MIINNLRQYTKIRLDHNFLKLHSGLHMNAYMHFSAKYFVFPIKKYFTLTNNILKYSSLFDNSHKKRKDSLGTRAEPAAFSLYLSSGNY